MRLSLEVDPNVFLGASTAADLHSDHDRTHRLHRGAVGSTPRHLYASLVPASAPLLPRARRANEAVINTPRRIVADAVTSKSGSTGQGPTHLPLRASATRYKNFRPACQHIKRAAYRVRPPRRADALLRSRPRGCGSRRLLFVSRQLTPNATSSGLSPCHRLPKNMFPMLRHRPCRLDRPLEGDDGPKESRSDGAAPVYVVQPTRDSVGIERADHRDRSPHGFGPPLLAQPVRSVRRYLVKGVAPGSCSKSVPASSRSWFASTIPMSGRRDVSHCTPTHCSMSPCPTSIPWRTQSKEQRLGGCRRLGRPAAGPCAWRVHARHFGRFRLASTDRLHPAGFADFPDPIRTQHTPVLGLSRGGRVAPVWPTPPTPGRAASGGVADARTCCSARKRYAPDGMQPRRSRAATCRCRPRLAQRTGWTSRRLLLTIYRPTFDGEWHASRRETFRRRGEVAEPARTTRSRSHRRWFVAPAFSTIRQAENSSSVSRL